MAATAESADQFRRQFTVWVDSLGTSLERRSDIVLGVYEALANAVEHAYSMHPTPGPVTVQAQLDLTGALNISVTDVGIWKTEEPARFRGRGLPLIAALSDTCALSTGSDGTVVTLHWEQIRRDL